MNHHLVTLKADASKFYRLYAGITAFALSAIASQAQSIDLSNPAVTSGVINRAIFSVDTSIPSGTGIFTRDTQGVFETIQETGVEQGYNTSASNIMDTKRVPQFNYELQFSDLHVVDIGGSLYVPFLLDINEPGNANNLLVLDDVRIFTSIVSGASYPTLASMLSTPNLNQVYSLDNTVGETLSYVLLDYNRVGSGSGGADMGMFIPLDVFNGTRGSDYVYLYSKFGGDLVSTGIDGSASGGFEEWTLGAGAAPIPEPGSAVLIGGVGLLVLLRRRRVTLRA